ncbi:MAG: hypothetical protein IT429_16995 [Gemmataceae bacterium]|nr:hypothetical protein [Gemmataceae bacterium]
MAALDDLVAARDNVARNLRKITESPKPSYSIDGESVSWDSLFAAYANQLAVLNQQIQLLGGPFELRTQGMS